MDDMDTVFNEINSELNNFQRIARNIKPAPGEIPSLPGIDIYGETIPFSGEVGGDHLIYIDFNKRFDLDARITLAREDKREDIVQKLENCRKKAGILLADASGHSITDALLTAMLHQSFLVGAGYELSMHGDISTNLFENINSRFYTSSSIDKYITMIYGEIHQNGEFRFISAGHPLPVVFSQQYNRIVDINPERMVIFPPIGTLPSSDHVDAKRQKSNFGYKSRYTVNTINIMGMGDIMVLFTDGFQDQLAGHISFVSERLEQSLLNIRSGSAREIVEHLKKDFFTMIPEPDDDVTVVVIRKG